MKKQQMTDRELLERLRAVMAEMTLLIPVARANKKYYTQGKLQDALDGLRLVERSLNWYAGVEKR
jgi:hypothetical protein